jgi:hypothetical protein
VRRRYSGYGTYNDQIKDISTDRKTVTVEFEHESDGEEDWAMDETERGVAMKEKGRGKAAGPIRYAGDKRKAGDGGFVVYQRGEGDEFIVPYNPWLTL